MFRFSLLAAAAALISFSAPASAGVVTTAYDFSKIVKVAPTVSVYPDGTAFIGVLGDPASFTAGPNAGLFPALGATVLGYDGVPDATAYALLIAFPRIANTYAFNVGFQDLFGTADSLIVAQIDAAGNVIPGATTVTTVLASTDAATGFPISPEGAVSGFSDTARDLLLISTTAGFDIADLTTTTIPEPAPLALLGAGLIGLAGLRRRA